jgi:hypothetical protein
MPSAGAESKDRNQAALEREPVVMDNGWMFRPLTAQLRAGKGFKGYPDQN